MAGLQEKNNAVLSLLYICRCRCVQTLAARWGGHCPYVTVKIKDRVRVRAKGTARVMNRGLRLGLELELVTG